MPVEKSYKKYKIQSKRSGAVEDEACKPTLWHYEKLLLLTDRETQRKSKSNLDDGTEDEVSHNYCNTVKEWPFS